MTRSRTSWRTMADWLDRRDRRMIAAAALGAAGIAGAGGAALAVLPCFALLGACCAAIALIDARHFLIPDRLTVLLLIAGLAATALDGGALGQRLIAVGGLWLALRLFAAVASWAKGRAAFGQGDVKLIAVSGSWLAPGDIAPFIAVAACAAVASHLFQRRGQQATLSEPPVPFGTTLAPTLAAFALLRQVIAP